MTETHETKQARGKLLEIASAAARFGLAAVWIVAGWTKIGAHMEVAQNIIAYEIFTHEWSNILAQWIGPLELAGGLLLLAGTKLRECGWVSIGVLVLFIIGMYSAWSRGLVIDCGCFGPQPSDEGTNLIETILRDVVLIAATLFMIYVPYKKFAIYP